MWECCYCSHHHHHHCQLLAPPSPPLVAFRIALYIAAHRVIYKLQKSWRNIRATRQINDLLWFITTHLFYMRTPKNESLAAVAVAVAAPKKIVRFIHWTWHIDDYSRVFFQGIPLILFIPSCVLSFLFPFYIRSIFCLRHCIHSLFNRKTIAPNDKNNK